jgi:hypothetical protein
LRKEQRRRPAIRRAVFCSKKWLVLTDPDIFNERSFGTLSPGHELRLKESFQKNASVTHIGGRSRMRRNLRRHCQAGPWAEWQSGAFIAFALLGFSVNTLTLFGLVLGSRTVVDDAIVVVRSRTASSRARPQVHMR